MAKTKMFDVDISSFVVEAESEGGAIARAAEILHARGLPAGWNYYFTTGLAREHGSDKSR